MAKRLKFTLMVLDNQGNVLENHPRLTKPMMVKLVCDTITAGKYIAIEGAN